MRKEELKGLCLVHLLRDSPSDAHETVLIYEDIICPSGPDIPFPLGTCIHNRYHNLQDIFICPCPYKLRFVLMYSHMIPIVTLILSMPRVHMMHHCDQITDIPSLCFSAPSLVVHMLLLSHAALQAINVSVHNLDLSYL